MNFKVNPPPPKTTNFTGQNNFYQQQCELGAPNVNKSASQSANVKEVPGEKNDDFTWWLCIWAYLDYQKHLKKKVFIYSLINEMLSFQTVVQYSTCTLEAQVSFSLTCSLVKSFYNYSILVIQIMAKKIKHCELKRREIVRFLNS